MIYYLGIPNSEEQFEKYRQINLKFFILNIILWLGLIFLLVSAIYPVKYSDFILIASFVLILFMYLYGTFLSRKLGEIEEKWLIKSSKVDLISMLLPFVVGMLVMGTISFWIIKEIANWPLYLFLIFPLILSLPLVVVVFFLFFRDDILTAVLILPTEPETIVNYLNSKMKDCPLKRNPWLGNWRAICRGVKTGVYVRYARGPMKSRVVVDNINRETLNTAKEIIKIINSYP